jgi:hypothetical protein
MMRHARGDRYRGECAPRKMINEGDSKISRGLIRRKQVYEVDGGQLYIAAVQPAGADSIAVQVRQSV